ncbi:MAG TPA: hypothetical protein VMV14_10235 [Acidimicrobiales bacterium]|nr:hypothetical protein [Acidimicrobiales bacterium]
MPPARYRCSACGNLTRFDVVTDRRTRAFHHYSVGGELHVEDEQVLTEDVVEVSCRWCGHGRAVELVATDDPPLHPSGTLSSMPDDRPEPGGA